MIHAPASDFAKNFGRYRETVQREPVGVTSHGRLTGVFISAEDFGEFQRLKNKATRAYWAWELPDDIIEAIEASRMDPRHDHLNALLDEEE